MELLLKRGCSKWVGMCWKILACLNEERKWGCCAPEALQYVPLYQEMLSNQKFCTKRCCPIRSSVPRDAVRNSVPRDAIQSESHLQRASQTTNSSLHGWFSPELWSESLNLFREREEPTDIISAFVFRDKHIHYICTVYLWCMPWLDFPVSVCMSRPVDVCVCVCTAHVIELACCVCVWSLYPRPERLLDVGHGLRSTAASLTLQTDALSGIVQSSGTEE